MLVFSKAEDIFRARKETQEENLRLKTIVNELATKLNRLEERQKIFEEHTRKWLEFGKLLQRATPDVLEKLTLAMRLIQEKELEEAIREHDEQMVEPGKGIELPPRKPRGSPRNHQAPKPKEEER